MEQLPPSTSATAAEGDDSNGQPQNLIQKKRKRKDKKIDYYAMAYETVRFTPIVADMNPLDEIAGVDHIIHATKPGSPSRLFKHSYRVSFHEKETKRDTAVDATTANEKTIASSQLLSQIIHQHANGLCIVTIGDDAITLSRTTMERIEFLATTAEACSAGARRKRQSEMLRKGSCTKGNNNSKQNSGNQKQKYDKTTADNNSGKNDTTKTVQDSNNINVNNNNDGVVTPRTVLANMHCRVVGHEQQQQQEENATMVLPIYAGVWGSLLELHTSVTSAQLTQDPLLDGYVAVILPTGPFPPKECLI